MNTTLREILARALYEQAARFSPTSVFPPWDNLTPTARDIWLAIEYVDKLANEIRLYTANLAIKVEDDCPNEIWDADRIIAALKEMQ